MEQNQNKTLLDVLLAFCDWCKSMCAKCADLLGQMVRLTWRKWFIVLPCVAVGIGFALYFTRWENRQYKVDGVLRLNGPTNFEVAQAMQPLVFALPTVLSEAQSSEHLLGNQIGYPTAYRFETFNVVDLRNDSVPDYVDFKRKHNAADTIDVVMTNRIGVRFRTKNLPAIATVQEGLINYLNSLPNLQTSFEAEKARMQTDCELCQKQIALLDTFAYEFYMHQSVGGDQMQLNIWKQGTFLGRREVEPVHPMIFDVLKHYQYTTHELAQMTAPVVVETAFAACPTAVWTPLKTGILFGLFMWIVGLLLAWPIENRKKLLDWLNQPSK